MDKLKKTLSLFGAAGGVAVPGAQFFTDNAPPLFPKAALVTAIIGVALLCVIWAYAPPRSRKTTALAVPLRLSLVLLPIAVILMIGLVIIDHWTTSTAPGRKISVQLGFGSAAWSLTPDGQECLAQSNGSIERCLLREAAYSEHGPERLWKPWTVYCAGILLIALYLLSFSAWTVALGIIAKYYS